MAKVEYENAEASMSETDTIPKEVLDRIGHLLEGAGSDSSRITLSRRDAEALGIVGSKEVVEEEYDECRAVDGKPVVERKKRKSPAIVALKIGDSVRSYEVNVGFARTALELKLDGRGISGMRQPEAPMVETPEEVNA